ncbi:MAG: hypothetical protein JWO60_3316, partial [Frankiales bacterium]|nr:hypothetical protein [Frankiales bacterium]
AAPTAATPSAPAPDASAPAASTPAVSPDGDDWPDAPAGDGDVFDESWI